MPPEGLFAPAGRPWRLPSAFALAFGLALSNALVSSLLGINDDDSFYRNVIRWAKRRQVHAADLDTPGTFRQGAYAVATRLRTPSSCRTS